MKYIRTKDGRIIDVSNMQEYETDDDNGYRVFDGYGDGKGNYYPAEEILEQSNNLGALVDRALLHSIDIIFLSEDRTKYRFEGGDDDNWYDVTDTEIGMGIYGGIWTPKGIVYVIKMNKERGWELL